MEIYYSYQLNPLLQKYIDCIWIESFFDQPFNREKYHLIIPDNTIELVFTKNWISRQGPNNEEVGKNLTHLSGFKTKPQRIKLSGSSLLCLRFKPYGLYRFTNMNAVETVDQAMEPVEIFGNSFAQLEEQVFAESSIEERIALIENFFLKLLSDFEFRQDPLFEAMVYELELTKGSRRIQSLAETYNMSIKTIERKFLSYAGVSPKKYSRLLRLFHAMKTLNSQPSTKMVEVAYNHGYYDQMHFVKEMRSILGMSATSYLKKDRSFQQLIFS